MSIKMTEDQEWMRRMAELEDGCCVSAGGLAADMGMLNPPEEAGPRQAAFDPRRVALARFVEFSRRKLRLSVELFAKKADVDIAEVLQIEDCDAAAPEPRVVFSIAAFLRADPHKFMELAGHMRPRDEKLGAEAVRFAAWSQGVEPLTKDEEKILGDFARAVVETADGR